MAAGEPGDEPVAKRVETHEADVWARCVELAARTPGDPLGAVVERSGAMPLAALVSVPSATVNRVVGLGVAAPATAEEINRLVGWYRTRRQTCFRVEVAPVAAPPGVADRLRLAGMRPTSETVTKVWRDLDDPEPAVDGTGDVVSAVRRLSERDAGEVAALNVRAWGAWKTTVSLAPWFSATVGHEGFDHYGLFVDGRLISTGVLVIDADLAWIGFDATHPRYRSRQLRQCLTLRRLADARAAGCRIVHAEARTDALTPRARLLQTLYERRIFTYDPSGAGPEDR